MVSVIRHTEAKSNYPVKFIVAKLNWILPPIGRQNDGFQREWSDLPRD